MLRRIRVGMALAPDRVCAVVPQAGAGGSAVSECSLRPWEGAGEWEDLRAALTHLRDRVGPRVRELAVAVLPPAVRVRRVELPSLPEADQRRILARDAARFFPRAHAAQRIGMAPVHSNKEPPQWMIAVVDAGWADAVQHAAEAAGWSLGSFVPAQAAWAAVAREVWPGSQTARFDLGVTTADGVEVVYLREGSIFLARSVSEIAGMEERISALASLQQDGEAAVPIGLLVPSAERVAMERALEARGATVASPGADLPHGGSADALAAAGAIRAVYPRMVSDAQFRERQRGQRRLVATLLAFSALLLLNAGHLYLRSLEQELGRVRAQRADVRVPVARVLSARDSIAAVSRKVEALNALEAGVPRWSVVIAEIAPHVPPDAHLLSFRGEDDRVQLAGQGWDALGVIRALGGVPGLVEVASDGPVQRGADPSGALVERFAISARVLAHRPRREEGL